MQPDRRAELRAMAEHSKEARPEMQAGACLLEAMDEVDRLTASQEQAEKDLYRKMVLACPEQNMLEHSGKHTDPWERLTSFVNASRQERHNLKNAVAYLKAVMDEIAAIDLDDFPTILSALNHAQALAVNQEETPTDDS